MFNSRLAPQSTAIFAMVGNSVSKHIPKSQYPSPPAPSGPFGIGLASLSPKGRAKLFSLSLSRFFRQVATIILKTFLKVKSYSACAPKTLARPDMPPREMMMRSASGANCSALGNPQLRKMIFRPLRLEAETIF